ncbi:MAG TPA: DUF6510 family protein [Thermomicrobiales bacterium]|nr:DUF6510 family protein [Thermomicrobiales bacterium]
MSGDLTDTRLDGNAAAGLLGAIFPFEMTLAVAVCDGCGATAQVAALTVYAQAPGLIARCPGCQAVLLRVVEGPDRYWLDLQGLRSLELVGT